MTRPVKVLHVLNELRPSGAETTLKVAGPRWAAHGVDADVLATGEEIGSYAPVLRDAGYRTGLLPLDPFRRFAPRFVRLLRREGYDAIHNHEERANAYVAALARANGVRVVQSLHNLFAFEGAAATERRLMRAAMRRMGVRMVSVSADVAAHEVERFGNPSSVIVNWYDDSTHHAVTPERRRAARAEIGLAEDALVVATVGNCNEVKNHQAVLHAMAALGRDDVVYLHAGTGPDEELEKSLAERLGLADRVRFMGFTPAAPVIAACDVFCMPSTVEGQGIAAIEAVAAGVPVLLADTPGLRTLKGIDPVLSWCEPTADGVADGLRHLLSDRPDTAELARAATAVRQVFDPDVGLAAFAALYRGE